MGRQWPQGPAPTTRPPPLFAIQTSCSSASSHPNFSYFPTFLGHVRLLVESYKDRRKKPHLTGRRHTELGPRGAQGLAGILWSVAALALEAGSPALVRVLSHQPKCLNAAQALGTQSPQ